MWKSLGSMASNPKVEFVFQSAPWRASWLYKTVGLRPTVDHEKLRTASCGILPLFIGWLFWSIFELVVSCVLVLPHQATLGWWSYTFPFFDEILFHFFLTPKSPLSPRGTIWNSGKFRWSQFLMKVFETFS